MSAAIFLEGGNESFLRQHNFVIMLIYLTQNDKQPRKTKFIGIDQFSFTLKNIEIESRVEKDLHIHILYKLYHEIKSTSFETHIYIYIFTFE